MRGYYESVAKIVGAKNGECVRSIAKKMEVPNILNNIQAKRTFNMAKETVNTTIKGKDTKFSFSSDFKLEVPESLSEDVINWKLKLPKSGSYKIGVISDIHFPYHNKGTVEAAFEDFYKEDIETIILNGDILDFYQVSRFNKIPNKAALCEEIDMARTFLKELRGAFPGKTIFYKEGNHEERLTKYITSSAAALFGLDEVKLQNLLKLEDFDIHFATGKEFIEAGHLNILHGHEILCMPMGINTARTLRLKASANLLFGHFHRTQQDMSKDIKGTIQGAWATGCACELEPDYMRVNNWNHGFAVVELDATGDFHVENKTFYKGKIY